MQRLFRHILVAVSGCALTGVFASEARTEQLLREATPRPPSQALHQSDEPPAPPVIVQQRAGATFEKSKESSPAAKLPLVPLPYRRVESAATSVTRSPSESPVPNQTHQTVGFFGESSSRAALEEFPRRTPIRPGAQQSMRQQAKRFQAVYRDSTISPYLNLFREEDDSDSAPNYFAFVRPQLEQIEANRAQQGELQQLSRQLQRRSVTVAGPAHRAGGVTGARTPARYMDTAQFYGGWRQ